jgi:hypothetical protein
MKTLRRQIPIAMGSVPGYAIFFHRATLSR